MRPLHRIQLLVLAAVVIVAVAAPGARAQPADSLAPAAQVHFDAAQVAYRAADYATAGRELEAAYRIDPKPALLYAWAQAERMGGDCPAALELYHRYVATGLNESQAAAAATGIKVCEPVQPAADALPPIEPGPAVASPGARPWYRNMLGNVLTVSGVVSAGVGVGFLVAANRSEARADDAELRDDFAGLLSEATGRRRIGYAAVGVGATLVVGGVLTYVLGRDHDHEVAAVGTDGATVFVRGAF
jgi:hypothetical protein